MSGLALKLLTLLTRQVSRPVANMLKSEAQNYAGFKKLCIGVAQKVHFFNYHITTKLNPSMKGAGKHLRPLNEAKAIQNGANFLSEAFIFAVAASGIMYETMRQRKIQKDKRDAMADDIATLQDEIEFMKVQLKQYNVQFEDYKVPKMYKPIILQVDEDGKLLKGNGLSEKKDEEDGLDKEQYQSIKAAIEKEMKRWNEKNAAEIERMKVKYNFEGEAEAKSKEAASK
ncbi:unnamed protein product [Ambrosiozyma monospora]|uniref:Unnamed protein product n=1 Tax=Ambrosiozyma monospora TaxID=43982 RepID=A0ACB5TBM0_AMBMO|nr:unnamed protein product [Ambrosiozyma monospora]